MLQFDWLKKLANCYGRPFARLGIRQKKRNLANPSQFNVIRIGKSWRIPKDLANPSFLANPYLANPSFSTIKNRALANPYILANPSSGEPLRSPYVTYHMSQGRAFCIIFGPFPNST